MINNGFNVKRICLSFKSLVVIWLFLTSTVSPVLATDWTKVFIEGANSHHSNGKIKFKKGSRLENVPYDGKLPAHSVQDNNNACWVSSVDHINCTASGKLSAFPAGKVEFAQCASNINDKIEPDGSEPEVSFPTTKDGYGHIHLKKNLDVKVTFTTVNGVYKIQHLKAESGTLEFAPGKYWIDKLEIGSDVEVIYPSNGTVSWFIKDKYTHVNNSAQTSSEQLLIYNYGDFELKESTNLKAYVFSEKKIKIFENAILTGAVSGGAPGESVRLNEDSAIIFADTANSINVIPNCEVKPVSPAVPAQCPAEQDNIQGLTYRTYDARTWDSTGDSPANHNEFEALIAQVKKTTLQIGESLESDIFNKGSGINPHSNAGADQDHYLGIFEGYIDAPVDGEYVFAIDGDDAIELLIDDEVVTGFYNAHGTCDCTDNQGRISLAQGTHKIELRFHEAQGQEAYRLYWQPPSVSSLVPVPASAYLTCPAPQFEFGRVTLINGKATINFANDYAAPPIVMLMPTIDGNDANDDGPSTVKLMSRTNGSAAITQDHPLHNHTTPKAIPEVDYFVMESGYRFLARGKALQAGVLDTKKYQGINATGDAPGYDRINFSHKFGKKPAMIGQTISRNNQRFITTTINNLDSAGERFDIAIEASELEVAITKEETLAYVAGLGKGTMTVNNRSHQYEFGIAKNHQQDETVQLELANQCNIYNINKYQNTYPSQPYTIANKNERLGNDGGWVRRCRYDSFEHNSVNFGIDEDQQFDTERIHRAEDIGYFAFEAEPPAPALDHYRINFSSDALSCTAKAITITACDNASCSTPSRQLSNVELTKNGEKYRDVSFTGETDTELWHGPGGVATIGLGATSPGAPYRCYIDGNLIDNDACSLNFAEAGFIFNIDNFLSNKSQTNIEIAAVKKSDASTQCVPAFADTSKTVTFWSEYVSPTAAAIVTGQAASVNGTNIAQSAIGATPFNLAFDSQGKAEFALNYADAGKIAIHANYTAAAGEDDEGLVMQGSDHTVRYPIGLCIQPEAVCTAADASCPKFKVAGETFDLSIQAMAWHSDGDTDYCDNLTTANYIQADIALGASLKQPVGGVLGNLSLNAYDHIAKVASLNALEQSISEVGVFTLTATPPNGYLGENIIIAAAESKPVGRFYPKDFEVYDHSMIPACGVGLSAFNYMDEPVPLMMTIRARNLSGATTQNYFGAFASGSANLVAEDANTGVDRQSRLTGLTAFNWSKTDQGVEAVSEDIQFTRLLNGATDGPYTSMAVGLQMTDDDGVLIGAPDMSADTADDCSMSHSCNAKQVTTQHYRYGRIVLANAYGPETEILRMPVAAEFWNGTRWVVNTLDSCTDIASAVLPISGVIYEPALVSPQAVSRIGGTNTVPNSDFSQGRFELLWQSLIATPNRYRGQVTAPLVVPQWLQWYWNYGGNNASELYDPRASAFFGTYRGHDKVIYWREVN